MRLLLVDDDPNKTRQIRGFVQEEFAYFRIEERRSFQSGLKEALLNPPDILLLDMTMPTYDVSGKETGGIERRYAGKEILRRLHRKHSATTVIVVTQFERFGEGEDLVTLDELRDELLSEFPRVFRGAVFYQAANAEWKVQLRNAIKQWESTSGVG
jgi:DNA-binding response OmpR family regulator